MAVLPIEDIGDTGSRRATSGLPARTDLIALARPRLVALGLAVVALSYFIAALTPRLWELSALLAGSLLSLCGASALNQVLERDTDAFMRRTADRPLPRGAVTPAAAAIYGLVLSAGGLAVLALAVSPLTAAITAAGWAIYVAVYTPLKTRSALATVVGAVPGAVPVLMGWSAGRGYLDLAAWTLFAVLFLWQLPHFLAIAWMYRADYRRAGLRMLPDGPSPGAATARQIAAYGLALVPASLLPTVVGLADSPLYFFGALALGMAYLSCGLRLGRVGTGAAAKRLLRASVLYLPALLTLLVIDVRFL